MGLKNCPECGKLCIENPSGVCPDCHDKQEQDEYKVAEYLRQVSKSTIEEIHKATGVKEKIILRMIKQSRIFGDVEVSYPCESCGAGIHEGRLCSKCSNSIIKQIRPDAWQAPEAQKEESRKSGRMYTKDMNKS